MAQLAEQLTCNQQVIGSSPIVGLYYGGIPEWPKGADCKSVVKDFEGSNPSPSILFTYSYAQIAQSVEQRTENPRVAGSIPALGTRFNKKFTYFAEHGLLAQAVEHWTFNPGVPGSSPG